MRISATILTPRHKPFKEDDAADDKPKEDDAADDEPKDNDDDLKDDNEESSSSEGTQSPKIAGVKREPPVTNNIVNKPLAQLIKRTRTNSMHYCA